MVAWGGFVGGGWRWWGGLVDNRGRFVDNRGRAVGRGRLVDYRPVGCIGGYSWGRSRGICGWRRRGRRRSSSGSGVNHWRGRRGRAGVGRTTSVATIIVTFTLSI